MPKLKDPKATQHKIKSTANKRAGHNSHSSRRINSATLGLGREAGAFDSVKLSWTLTPVLPALTRLISWRVSGSSVGRSRSISSVLERSESGLPARGRRRTVQSEYFTAAELCRAMAWFGTA